MRLYTMTLLTRRYVDVGEKVFIFRYNYTQETHQIMELSENKWVEVSLDKHNKLVCHRDETSICKRVSSIKEVVNNLDFNYIRFGIFDITEIMNKIGNTQLDYVDEDCIRVQVRLNTDKLKLFKNSITCVKCGLKGAFFALECSKTEFLRGERIFHFNMYALDDAGNEILMTKDHITPKSKGGANSLKNYQTMCVNCNWEKGNNENF